MSNFGSKLFGSKLKYRLGAGLLLLGAAWLAQAAITITLSDGSTCTDGTITQAPDGSLSASCSAPPPGPFALTVTKAGTGGGNVTSNPAGINCGATCTASYASGTSVILTASAASGSTFAGWSGGACTGTGTCNLNITANLTVTATFNTSGGGGGGSDPGTGLWINGNNYVHDRGGLLELYVPRCVPSQYDNCRGGGGRSQYDTLVAGQVWAMRIPTGSVFANQRYPFSIQRSETGETLTSFDFAISTTVNDFGVTAACKATGDATLYVYGVGSGFTPSKFYPACPLTPGSLYYLNVRPAAGSAGEALCGIGSGNACRYRIVLPGGFPYSR